ncbi:MAG: SDR family oxidoreductase [Pseudomonadota bacterium]|nr:SDR family oxidoreductase [Pseudomonadota bacterium]
MSTILLIGASRGIGLELAHQYSAAGDRVIATARDDAGLSRLRGLGCHALRLDVADPASNSSLAWQLDGEKLDAAWYIAGVICNRADATQPPTQPEFDRVMHANVLGAMQLIPQVAPTLADGAPFAFISSQMGRIASVESSDAWLYRTSKAALNMAVAAAQASYPGVRMVCFHPGWVQTEMGGAQAPVTPQASASGLRATLAQLPPSPGRALFMRFEGQTYESW